MVSAAPLLGHMRRRITPPTLRRFGSRASSIGKCAPCLCSHGRCSAAHADDAGPAMTQLVHAQQQPEARRAKRCRKLLQCCHLVVLRQGLAGVCRHAAPEIHPACGTRCFCPQRVVAHDVGEWTGPPRHAEDGWLRGFLPREADNFAHQSVEEAVDDFGLLCQQVLAWLPASRPRRFAKDVASVQCHSYDGWGRFSGKASAAARARRAAAEETEVDGRRVWAEVPGRAARPTSSSAVRAAPFANASCA